MSNNMIDPKMMRLLVALSEVADNHFRNLSEYYGEPLSLKVTINGDTVAQLFEEGWSIE